MSLVQVHSTCWAHCWQRSETALAIAEVVEDHKHSWAAQLSLGVHDARFKRAQQSATNRWFECSAPGAPALACSAGAVEMG